MHFRDLLMMLPNSYLESSFRVNELRAEFSKVVLQFPGIFAGLILNPRLLTIKSISNDMRRLYLMGFVTRKREKRPNPSAIPPHSEYRGFQYRYKITGNGRRYIEYLNRIDYKFKTMNSNRNRDTSIEGLNLGPDALLDVEATFKNIKKMKGFQARFAGLRERENLYTQVQQQKERIRDLENQVTELQLQNAILLANKQKQ